MSLTSMCGILLALSALLSTVACKERGQRPAIPAHIEDTEGQSTEYTTEYDSNINFPVYSVPENISKIYHFSHERVSRQIVTASTERLLFANRRYIVTMQLDGSDIQGFDLSTIEATNAIAVDFDIRAQKIYWTNVITGTIRQMNMDGTDVRLLASFNVTVPDGLAWDWVNKKLYWTDATEEDIEVLDPNTFDLQRKVLIDTGTGSTPRAIVVDPARRCMYWTDWGVVPRIERAAMDGSARTLLHNTELGWPNALTLDYDNQVLYWGDALLDKFEKSNVDGSNRQLLTAAFYQPFHIFGIVVFNGRLYWTDWEHNAVISSTVYQPWGLNVVRSGFVYDPMAIHVLSEDRQPVATNPCATNNGGCSHLCLLRKAFPGYSCACPEPLFLASDKRQCISEVITTAPPTTATTEPPTVSCTPPCQNGGECISGHCQCPTGNWTGVRCEQAVCNPPCENGGQCIAPGECYCTREWEGEYCQDAICFPPSGCLHGGVCIRPGHCSCAQGWSGERCEDAECVPGCVNGECIAPDKCFCDTDYKGALCNEAICYPPDGCLHGGHCSSPGACLCPVDWKGLQCQDAVCRPECLHGHCIDPGTCLCNIGWSGKRCTEAQCFPPCENGGTCYRPGHCICSPGWGGDRCNTRATTIG